MGRSRKMGLSNKERYDYLIKARNFHYENFNKWMTYFYVAIGALFVGYYNVANNKEMEQEEIILVILGYLTSLFWYWSSKGYYYWNINFITLVNDCEKHSLKLKKKNRVYFVFANKSTQNNYLDPLSGANISTSKVALLFSFVVSVVWCILILDQTYFHCGKLDFFIKIILAVCITLMLSIIVPKLLLKSNHGHFPDLRINQDR